MCLSWTSILPMEVSEVKGIGMNKLVEEFSDKNDSCKV